MPLILPVEGVYPVIESDCFIAENATVVGDVTLGMLCSVWFNAVIRGDVNRIRIGAYTNIQAGAVIHCTYQTGPTTIGSLVTLGHKALEHDCDIKDRILIGMDAIVLDHAADADSEIIAA